MGTMKTLKVAPLIFLLIWTVTSITRWPSHTICKTDNLEVKYRSCDRRQDFAFSFDGCSNVLPQTANIRIGTILRHPIRELTVDVSLAINGKKVPVYSKKICERDHPQFSFCGKKKGEYVYYEAPIDLGVHEIPQGDFNVTVEMFNEDHQTIICADFTVRNLEERLS
uniref:Lymphocyte antigen 86 isoform X1 n=1 Tax=Pogona vitticeps TaxID=103695 RepID=A0A6J0TH52_9SAUR